MKNIEGCVTNEASYQYTIVPLITYLSQSSKLVELEILLLKTIFSFKKSI
jgi:hypothetical protein